MTVRVARGALLLVSQVLDLSGTYGELDGANNYAHATTFAEVHRSLDADQKTKLMDLQTTPYLDSAVISDTTVLEPYTGNTDPLFFAP